MKPAGELFLERRYLGTRTRWFVYAKRPFRIEGPGRYTTMTPDVGEFIRRFLSHVLPKGFHRIRHYGLFASSNRAETIARARELLGLVTSAADASTKAQHTVETDPPAQACARPCPRCGGRMFIIETFDAGRQPRQRPAAPGVAIRIDTS
jgi:Putative transposase